MPRKPPTRRQRRHGDLPAGFLWREGRPRWVPSPTRRQAGWKATDLRDAWGHFLALGPAIERAAAIAKGVEAWAAGDPVPADLAAIAPAGATAVGKAKGGGHPRAIRTLLDKYYASLKFRRLGERTQADYKNKISRFLGLARGKVPEAKFYALPVDVLLPPAFGEAGVDVLAETYDLLRETAGDSMAAGCLACVSAWMGYLVKRERVWPTNPAAGVERETPEGRIVVYEWPEILALVTAAEARGLASIADAIVLAVDLSWSQQDLLALKWDQISAGDTPRVKHRRIKTGNAGNPPLLPLGRGRLEAIHARWKDAKVRPLHNHVLVCELTGKPWSADTFRHYFAEIRAAVADQDRKATGVEPPIAGKQFRDFRDTAITYCYEAGLEIPEICSRTMHAPTRAQAVIEKHYGAISSAMADRGAAKLEAYFGAMGYRLEKKEGEA